MLVVVPPPSSRCRREDDCFLPSSELLTRFGKSADSEEYAARRSFSTARFDVAVDRLDLLLLLSEEVEDEPSKSCRDVCLRLLLRVRLPTAACLFMSLCTGGYYILRLV